MLVNCMLDSSATHSFVHPRIVQSMETQLSQAAVLTVALENDSKVFFNDASKLDLKITAEGGFIVVSLYSTAYKGLHGLNFTFGFGTARWQCCCNCM